MSSTVTVMRSNPSSGPRKRGANDMGDGDDEFQDEEEADEGDGACLGPVDVLNRKKVKAEDYPCPFRKRNPLRYNVREWEYCAKAPFKSMTDLKKHIIKIHRQQQLTYSCVRCHEVFPRYHDLNAHLLKENNDMCKKREPSTNHASFDDHVSPDVESQLRSRSQHFDWPNLWLTLFPNDEPEKIPDPDFEPPVELHEVSHEYHSALPEFQDKLATALGTLLPKSTGASHASGGTQNTDYILRSMIENIVNDFMDDVFRKAKAQALNVSTSLNARPPGDVLSAPLRVGVRRPSSTGTRPRSAASTNASSGPRLILPNQGPAFASRLNSWSPSQSRNSSPVSSTRTSSYFGSQMAMRSIADINPRQTQMSLAVARVQGQAQKNHDLNHHRDSGVDVGIPSGSCSTNIFEPQAGWSSPDYSQVDLTYTAPDGTLGSDEHVMGLHHGFELDFSQLGPDEQQGLIDSVLMTYQSGEAEGSSEHASMGLGPDFFACNTLSIRRYCQVFVAPNDTPTSSPLSQILQIKASILYEVSALDCVRLRSVSKQWNAFLSAQGEHLARRYKESERISPLAMDLFLPPTTAAGMKDDGICGVALCEYRTSQAEDVALLITERLNDRHRPPIAPEGAPELSRKEISLSLLYISHLLIGCGLGFAECPSGGSCCLEEWRVEAVIRHLAPWHVLKRCNDKMGGVDCLVLEGWKLLWAYLGDLLGVRELVSTPNLRSIILVVGGFPLVLKLAELDRDRRSGLVVKWCKQICLGGDRYATAWLAPIPKTPPLSGLQSVCLLENIRVENQLHLWDLIMRCIGDYYREYRERTRMAKSTG
ncbi:hypothetical protein QBC47DRAFT_362472 [Echria macrotheca]|uniref:C2H2-type domain-containing protein n=1 Tax=Echria macrotheca TaxID=438768 RepID=A0AAJ0B8S6_9PEZI|nr:hypothetical protein QBC47DRAFT_362472 [Echria macrotheca]